MHSISNSNTDKSHKLDDDRVELKKHNDDAITKISNIYATVVCRVTDPPLIETPA